MTVERREENRRSDDARDQLQHDMNAAAFGASHASAVSEERQQSQIDLIWAELKWHKYLLLAVVAGVFGQYLGLADTAAKAMPFK